MERELKERKKPDLAGQVTHMEGYEAKMATPKFSSVASPGSCPLLREVKDGHLTWPWATVQESQNSAIPNLTHAK